MRQSSGHEKGGSRNFETKTFKPIHMEEKRSLNKGGNNTDFNRFKNKRRKMANGDEEKLEVANYRTTENELRLSKEQAKSSSYNFRIFNRLTYLPKKSGEGFYTREPKFRPTNAL